MNGWIMVILKLIALPAAVTWILLRYSPAKKLSGGPRSFIKTACFLFTLIVIAVIFRPWLGRVPDFSHGVYTVKEAESIIEEAGLTPDVSYVFSEESFGKVISQDQTAGQEITINSVMKVVISRGNPKVPDLTGMTLENARQKLEEYSLKWNIGGHSYSNLNKDCVVSYEPLKDTSVTAGTTVTLTLSLGKPFMPADIIGMPGQKAYEVLTGYGVKVELNGERSVLAPGTVLRTEPPTGTVLTVGQEVRLYVSTRKNGRIDSPKNGATVFGTVTVLGQADPGNIWYIFIYTQETGEWFPQSELPLQLGASGNFSQQVFVGTKVEGADTAKHFDVCLVSVEQPTRRNITLYYQDSRRTGIYKGMVFPPDANIVSKIEVVRQ